MRAERANVVRLRGCLWVCPKSRGTFEGADARFGLLLQADAIHNHSGGLLV